MIYFKFEAPIINKTEEKENKFYFFLGKFLLWFIPKANPTFDFKYDDVSVWYIEYDDIEYYVNREIGLNKSNQIVTIGPFKDNLGLWTDEDLSLKDYEIFKPVYITKEDFENLWDTENDSNIPC